MRNELLLPCPFCGGEARMHASHHGDTHYYQVECGNDYDCGAWPAVRVCHSEAEAIKAWNTRAERTCNMELVGRNSYVCSACGSLTHWQHVNMPNYCPDCGAKVAEND